MNKVAAVLGGVVVFLLLFIAAMNVTGMVARTLGVPRTLDDALTAAGILIAAAGAFIFARTIWTRSG
jgi:NO-binding membrane sensor protein with MHYT domain